MGWGGVREEGGGRGLEMKEMQLEVGEGPLDDEDLIQVLDPFARSFLIHISFQVRMLFEWECPGVGEGVNLGPAGKTLFLVSFLQIILFLQGWEVSSQVELDKDGGGWKDVHL